MNRSQQKTGRGDATKQASTWLRYSSWSVLIAFLTLNVVQLAQRTIFVSFSVLFGLAVIYGAIGFFRLINIDKGKQSPDRELERNIKMAQDILDQQAYGIYRYLGGPRKVVRSDLGGLTDILQSPIVILICAAVSTLLFLNAAILMAEKLNDAVIGKLFITNIVNFTLLSGCVTGVLLLARKIIRGHKQ